MYPWIHKWIQGYTQVDPQNQWTLNGTVNGYMYTVAW